MKVSMLVLVGMFSLSLFASPAHEVLKVEVDFSMVTCPNNPNFVPAPVSLSYCDWRTHQVHELAIELSETKVSGAEKITEHSGVTTVKEMVGYSECSATIRAGVREFNGHQYSVLTAFSCTIAPGRVSHLNLIAPSVSTLNYAELSGPQEKLGGEYVQFPLLRLLSYQLK